MKLALPLRYAAIYRDRAPGVQSRLRKTPLSTWIEPVMSSSSPAPTGRKDLGDLIEDERLPAGRDDLLEPLVRIPSVNGCSSRSPNHR